MRTLIVTEFITLDGVVEAPGGEPTHPHSGWTVPYGVTELYALQTRGDSRSRVVAARTDHLPGLLDCMVATNR